MVTGLDRFREHLGAYDNQYILIGGTACWLLLNELGFPFRATKDIDLVLCVEELTEPFARSFWGFIRSGGYALQQTAAGRTHYYRFSKPEVVGYPSMLELFSRKPDGLDLAAGSHLTPITFDEVSSLSAILLDDTYYAFLRSGRQKAEGLPVAGPEYLIPLKARAWVDVMVSSMVARFPREAASRAGRIRRRRRTCGRIFIMR